MFTSFYLELSLELIEIFMLYKGAFKFTKASIKEPVHLDYSVNWFPYSSSCIELYTWNHKFFVMKSNFTQISNMYYYSLVQFNSTTTERENALVKKSNSDNNYTTTWSGYLHSEIKSVIKH